MLYMVTNGDDTLTGGPGADEFFCGTGTDTVTDFEVGIDEIKDGNNCENVINAVSPPVITDPTNGDVITDCVDPFTVTGTSAPGTDQIILYKKVGATLTPLNYHSRSYCT